VTHEFIGISLGYFWPKEAVRHIIGILSLFSYNHLMYTSYIAIVQLVIRKCTILMVRLFVMLEQVCVNLLDQNTRK
jgi:hypothetical protein